MDSPDGHRGWGRGHPWVHGRSRISGQAYVDAKGIQMYTAHRCTRIEEYIRSLNSNKVDKDYIH